jgi:hypothetical protein
LLGSRAKSAPIWMIAMKMMTAQSKGSFVVEVAVVVMQ